MPLLPWSSVSSSISPVVPLKFVVGSKSTASSASLTSASEPVTTTVAVPSPVTVAVPDVSTLSVPSVPLSVDSTSSLRASGSATENSPVSVSAVSSSVVWSPGTVFSGSSSTSVTEMPRSAGSPTSSPSNAVKRIVRDGPGSSLDSRT